MIKVTISVHTKDRPGRKKKQLINNCDLSEDYIAVQGIAESQQQVKICSDFELRTKTRFSHLLVVAHLEEGGKSGITFQVNVKGI